MKLLRSKVRSNREHGVTMLLIAFAMMSLLAMAVLAIDVTTLYVAQGEAQNAADAAALAGAKMFVTSQVTSVSGAVPPVTSGDVCQNGGPGSAAAANRVAEATATQNTVSGQAAAVKTIACDFSQAGNPHITVTIERTQLPTFFARIWRAASNTVTATATAEAFNASGLTTQIQVQSVKPWLVPNCAPTAAAGANPNCANAANVFYVNPADGSINTNLPSVLGQSILLHRIRGNDNPTSSGYTTGKFDNSFYSLNVPDVGAPVCPSSAAPGCNGFSAGADPYEDSIACASRYQFQCGQAVGPGGITVFTDNSADAKTIQRTQCLIHADSSNSLDLGQDQFTVGTAPVSITAGYNNPNSTLATATTPNISRSDSIVTLPLYDGRQLCFGNPAVCTESATVVGFLQLGIMETQNSTPVTLQAVILNVVGCKPGATGNPIVGTGLSPIPVRLIHN